MTATIDTGIGMYLETVAWSLVAHAGPNKDFKELLTRLIRERTAAPQAYFSCTGCVAPNAEWLIPLSPNDARKKAEWLMNELDYVESAERESLLGILGTACLQEWPLPEDAAWGILFNETLGPTRGNPSVWQVEYTQVVIVQDWGNGFGPHEFARLVSEASSGALYRCIENANHDFRRVEPEVLAWLSDSRSLEIYHADTHSQFESVVDWAIEFGINNWVVNSDSGMAGIGLQPAAKGTYYKLIQGLRKS